MEVFRISDKRYATGLTASGKPNRWNKNNEFVLYTGGSRSLSTLELVVHRANLMQGVDYEVMVISIPDEEQLYTRLQLNELPRDWKKMSSYTALQDIGSEWYHSNKSLILRVPSAIIPQEYNYLINIQHPDFKQVTLVRTEPYFWDQRLL